MNHPMPTPHSTPKLPYRQPVRTPETLRMGRNTTIKVAKENPILTETVDLSQLVLH